MIEDLPILLNYTIEGNNLILRLDNLGSQNFTIEEQSINKITLKDFINTESLSNNFQELIGEVFEYEIYYEENKSILGFWGDYGRVENSIESSSITEEYSQYTIEDLCQKGKTLADLYSGIYESYIQNQSVFHTLRDKLKIELKDEIVRFQRKAEFFESKEISKSEAFRSQIKVLQKLLNYVEKP